MKNALRLYAITLLFSATALQGSEDQKISLRARKEFGPTIASLRVTVYQNDTQQSTGSVGIGGDTLTYYLNKGSVTLVANFNDAYGDYTTQKTYAPDWLLGRGINVANLTPYDTKRVRVGGEMKDVAIYQLDIRPVIASAPYQSIHVYKPVEEKTDWTVVIAASDGTEISSDSFKKNTSLLHLALNRHEIKDNGNKVYNSNTITVYRGKQKTGVPVFPPKTITINDFDSKKPELEISATGANFVAKGTEKKSKVPDKKIRAYKTVEDKFDWTVQITDNSDNEISHATFKKNTDGLTTRSLYLRLNPNEITDSESQKRYNANKVKVFKGKKIIGTPFIDKLITVANFNAILDGELQISDDDATIVAKGLEKK